MPTAQPAVILVVDDDEDVRELITDVLQAEGHVVIAVDNGETAWAILGSFQPIDLLLTDVFMPGGFSGADIASRLGERRFTLKSILMSGRTRSEFVALEHVPFLRKPFNVSDLVAIVRRTLATVDTTFVI